MPAANVCYCTRIPLNRDCQSPYRPCSGSLRRPSNPAWCSGFSTESHSFIGEFSCVKPTRAFHTGFSSSTYHFPFHSFFPFSQKGFSFLLSSSSFFPFCSFGVFLFLSFSLLFFFFCAGFFGSVSAMWGRPYLRCLLLLSPFPLLFPLSLAPFSSFRTATLRARLRCVPFLFLRFFLWTPHTSAPFNRRCRPSCAFFLLLLLLLPSSARLLFLCRRAFFFFCAAK